MHGDDGKSFVGERSRIVHDKYEEILRKKQHLNMIFIHVKNTIKLSEKNKRKEYTDLDLK